MPPPGVSDAEAQLWAACLFKSIPTPEDLQQVAAKIKVVKVVLLSPSPCDPDGSAAVPLCEATMPDFMLRMLKWVDSPVSKLVDMPLKIASVSKREPETRGIPNLGICTLLKKVDPMVGHFGFNLGEPVKGCFVVARCDGQHLEGENVSFLISFVQEAFTSVYTKDFLMLEEGVLKDALRKVALEMLRPKKFQQYLQKKTAGIKKPPFPERSFEEIRETVKKTNELFEDRPDKGEIGEQIVANLKAVYGLDS